ALPRLQVPALPALRAGGAYQALVLYAVAERLRLGQRLELLQRVVLDLTDALARDAERLADLLECARLPAGEAEPQLDHLTLPLGQRGERGLDVGAAERQRRSFVGLLRVLVLH